jgi:putative regulator of septum formation
MVAPTGVNEGTPQEPVAAGSPGSATAGTRQAEAGTEDPAGAAADLGEPAGDLKETALAKVAPAGSAAREPVPAEVVPAQAGPIEAEPTEAELAGLKSAEDRRAEADRTDAGRAEAGNADAGPPDAEPTKAAPAEAEAAEAGPAQAGSAEAGATEAEAPAAAAEAPAAAAEAPAAAAAAASTGSEPITAELTQKGLVENRPAEKGGPGLADGQENQAGEAPEAGEAQEASRDVGPLAVVGIIVGVIALVGVAAGVLAMVTHGFKPKTVVTYRPAAVFGLQPGQCVNAGSNSLSFTPVSCASPHDAEVFARFSLPAAAWPGSTAVRQEAGDGCASRLSGYLNPQLASIGLTQEYVYPSRDAWEANQRTVVCEVSSGNGRLTGSVRAKT